MFAVCGAAMAQSPVVIGDVDGDGECTINDVTALYNYLLFDDSSAMVAGDQDGDGYITVGDVTWVYNVMLYVSHDDGHDYIDLGLPSGTLWATTNVGATAPEEYGDYFAWGETTPKDVYDWSTYKWCNGDYNQLTKYCTSGDYGYNGFTDEKTELDPEDDAATAAWGAEWRMPSLEQMQELMDNCTTEWTMRNGVSGFLFTSNINGASLFLPAAGDRWDSELFDAGSYGDYWSRALNSSTPYGAYVLGFYSGGVYWNGNWGRYGGHSVRAVRVQKEQEHEYVDLGLPSGTQWATMNIGATSPEEYGDYFAWGETEPKDVYDWSTYKWCNGDYNQLTKYCTSGDYGYNGFTDEKTELDPEDDAATAAWGAEWRMPSKDQMEELYNNCTSEWTTRNGVNGRLFTSNINGASLFLPAAGYRWDGELSGAGSRGYYWSRPLVSSYPSSAYYLYFDSGYVSWNYNWSRYLGQSVRAVRVP